MIRSFSIALAILALACAADAAFAGGRSNGSSKANTQSVRIKNIGPGPVLVNAANGSATGAAGASRLGLVESARPQQDIALVIGPYGA